MDTTRMSSKGQVIIPKDVRDAKGWREGAELIVESRPDGVLLRSPKPFKPTTLDDVIGCANYKGPPKTIKEIEDAIKAGWRAQAKRKSK